MTSKPASLRARAMTLAPRSWPSRPGLAMSTRSGLASVTGLGRLQELDEHAQRGGWLQEGDFAVGAWPGRLVDQLDALVFEVTQVLADVGCSKAEMVQARSAAFEKPRDG